MKRIVLLVVIILLLTALSLAGHGLNEKSEKKAIEKVILEFMDGCMNNYEEEAVIKCFHPDFNGLSMENDSINVSTRSIFVEYVRKMKTKEPEGRKTKRTARIISINVVRDIGLAEFETYSGDELLGTDFIVLLKSDGVWKFVRSVTLYHDQEEKINVELEKAKIEKVIKESLVDAAGNYWDIEKWKMGFHPGFTGLTCVGSVLEKDEFSDWEQAIKAMKIKEPEGHRKLITGKIPRIDVLGHMGIAEVKIYYGTELNETAYILFFKFSDGWKVVSKVGMNHNQNGDSEIQKEAVKKVIQDAYIEGIQNLGKIQAIEKGFHSDFALLYIIDNKLEKLQLPEWIESVKKRKRDNPEGPREKASANFLFIDVTGGIATAKLELFRGSELLFTDMLTLLKFNDGWRIVSKVAQSH